MSAVTTAPRSSALGSYVELAVTDERALPEAQRLLRSELDELDLACSRFRADSELVRVNARAGRPTPAGALLRDAVRVALNAADDTDGLVDPTLGTALVQAGYDRDFASLPGDREADAPNLAAPIPSARAGVVVDDHLETVLVPPECALDLGATAKALGADRAAALLADRLGVGVLVSLGGDVAAAGQPPTGGWAVRTIASTAGGVDDGETVLISGGGLATSSPAARRWRRGGSDQHHIIDPRTGRPAETCWSAVSVAAPTCVEANTAATAAVVLGSDALAWLNGTALPARVVADDGAVHRLNGWPQPGGVVAMMDFTEPVLWYIARASGLMSFVLLTVSVVVGIAAGARTSVLPRFVTQGVHRAAALTGVLLLVVHVVAIVVDPYVAVGWVDVWWPFAADHLPLWTGLGTLAVDLLALIVLTSLVRQRMGVRAWRCVHLTAYAAYALSVAHGIGAGTDVQQPWGAALTATSVGVVLASLAVRVRREKEQPGSRYDAKLEART